MYRNYGKRLFDFLMAIAGLTLVMPVLVLGWIAAAISTRDNGLFVQRRIGRFGKPFLVFKLRSMRSNPAIKTPVTTDHDPRITRVGRFLRKTKMDELPQLINVLLGQMSLVGPRPDVPGFADCLEGDDRIILELRPGITGPASLAFRNEEELLSGQEDPEQYNRSVIWPQKVALNRQYAERLSFGLDLRLILQTIWG